MYSLECRMQQIYYTHTHTCAGIPHPATYRRRPFPYSSCHTYMLAYTHHLSLSLSCMLRYATHPHSRTQLAYTHALTYKHLQAALPAALTCSHALIHRYSHSHTLNTLCTRTYSLCVCARARACVCVLQPFCTGDVDSPDAPSAQGETRHVRENEGGREEEGGRVCVYV